MAVALVLVVDCFGLPAVFARVLTPSYCFKKSDSNFFFFDGGLPSISSFSNFFFSGESGLRKTLRDFFLPGFVCGFEINLICLSLSLIVLSKEVVLRLSSSEGPHIAENVWSSLQRLK